MKIKKTFQGSIPENKILNSNSTSQTDTYSCEKINEMTEEIYSTEATIELTAPSVGGEDSNVMSYPEGFNSTNCYISSIMFYRVHPTSTVYTTWYYLSGNYNVRLQETGVVLNVGNNFSDQYLGKPVKIVLRKYK